jgi:hypothetical protein
MSGDFSFWSIYKTGNYGDLTSKTDFNNNASPDWNEYLHGHKSFYLNPTLYEEIHQNGYGNFDVDYEHKAKFPIPPSGSWADWINH